MPCDERNQNAHIYQVDLSMAVFHRVDRRLFWRQFITKSSEYLCLRVESVLADRLDSPETSSFWFATHLFVCNVKTYRFSYFFLSFHNSALPHSLFKAIRHLFEQYDEIPFFKIDSRLKPASASLNYLLNWTHTTNYTLNHLDQTISDL